MPAENGVLSVFYFHPKRIAGTAMFLAELARQLRHAGRACIACFASAPTPEVAEFLAGNEIVFDYSLSLFEGTLGEQRQAVQALVARYRPAVIHFHFMGLIGIHPWAARLAGVRQIFFTDHRSLAEDETNSRWPWSKVLAARAIQFPVTGVVTVSDFQRESHLRRNSLSPHLVRTIHNGVDLDRADSWRQGGREFRDRYSIPVRCLLITQISWLIAEKGVEDFIAAAEILVLRVPGVHFCLAGAGPAEGHFRDLVRTRGLEGSVTFTGDLFDPFVSGVFEATDIFCQPSRWQEAFGWVIAEAMAFHKPVVGTRTGGIPEVIDDGVTGWLCAPRDPQEFAEKLEVLAADPEMRFRMGEAGRRAVEEQFSLTANTARYLELYRFKT